MSVRITTVSLVEPVPKNLLREVLFLLMVGSRTGRWHAHLLGRSALAGAGIRLDRRSAEAADRVREILRHDIVVGSGLLTS